MTQRRQEVCKGARNIMNKIGHHKNILLLGDFNIDLFKDSTLSASLSRLSHTTNLTNIIKDATRVTATSSSSIDLAHIYSHLQRNWRSKKQEMGKFFCVETKSEIDKA